MFEYRSRIINILNFWQYTTRFLNKKICNKLLVPDSTGIFNRQSFEDYSAINSLAKSIFKPIQETIKPEDIKSTSNSYGCKKITYPCFLPKIIYNPVHLPPLTPLTRRCSMQGAGRNCYQKVVDLELGHELYQSSGPLYITETEATIIHSIYTTDQYSKILGN